MNEMPGHTSTVTSFLNGRPKRMLIGGEWLLAASGRTFSSINPATGDVLAELAEGGAEDVDRAVAAARRAFNGPWGRMKPYERQALILRLADLVKENIAELALIDTLDMGMPVSRTAGYERRAVGLLRYYAGLTTAIHGETIENSFPGEMVSFTVKEPVGVVAAIVPWNSPVSSILWKVGPVLAAGCTMVLKPAEEASLSALRLGELILEAGIPEGVVNVVTGFGETAGAALAEHCGVDKLAFTGSHITGQKIIRASAGNLKRLSLELGGKSPDIVFADADLDVAVPNAAMGTFSNSGQVCSAGTRLLIERSIYGEFVERVAEFAKSLVVGNGLDPKTQIGPLVSRAQFDRVAAYLDIGKAEGASAAAGGTVLSEGALGQGYFINPTVFANANNNMRIAREEIFGPVISAIPFDSFDEAMAMANDTEFGLAGGVWTRDVGKAHAAVRAIRAGTVWVNCYQTMDPAVPFGGYKMSGYGKESGLQHVEEFLEVKAVWINTQ